MRLIFTVILALCTLTNNSNEMGLDVMLVSKERGENRAYHYKLSRGFCNFLCGPDAYQNCEFDQVQKITGLDLSLFRKYPANFEPDIHELEYKLYLANEENDTVKIEQIEKEIEQSKFNWDKSYDSIYEGWTKIEELKEVSEKLISLLKENVNIHKDLEYNFNWGNYFELNIRQSETEASYVSNTLIEDLISLLKGLKNMEEKGITYVAFSYG